MVEEDCQTEDVQRHSREVQVNFKVETATIGQDCQEELLKELEQEIEKRIKEEVERKQAAKARLQLNIPMDSSGGQEIRPKAPMTSKVHSTKMDFSDEAVGAHKSPDGSS